MSAALSMPPSEDPVARARAVAPAIEAGATAIFESQPFERRFRDLHAVTQPVQARRNHFETVGQHLMGPGRQSSFPVTERTVRCPWKA